MRKLIIIVCAFVAFVAPSAADAAPNPHDKPVVSQKFIDWD